MALQFGNNVPEAYEDLKAQGDQLKALERAMRSELLPLTKPSPSA